MSSNSFSEVLHALVRDPRWYEGHLTKALHAVTEAASNALRTPRVSVWELAEDGSGIRCANLFDVREGGHSGGGFLAVQDCPEYFDAISHARIVAVADAVDDPRTRGLAPGYLAPLGIGALLDAPILIDGKLAGVVCHEALGSAREWTEAERTFAASIGDLVALAYQSARRREAEHVLRTREREMHVALEASGVADWNWDMKADRVRWSEGVGPIFGRPPGWQPEDFGEYMAAIHEDDRQVIADAVERAIATEGAYFVEHRIRLPDGRIRWLQCRGQVLYTPSGEPAQIAGVLSDHTERRELEHRLARGERLESLGRLAGGVAHDFNNLLTAILGSCELMELELSTESQRARLGQIEAAANRASDLSRQLLAFSRRLPQSPRPVDVSDAVNRSLRLLERLLGEDVSVVVDTSAPAWVLADSTQMEQVIMNLAVNARDAMPGGGTLAFAVEELDLEGKPFVELAVADDGTGIGSDAIDRIFEPFFTTKPDQHGTGLGLAMCHGIVHQYGGHILVESELGQGTTFRVRLPRSEPAVAADPEPSPQELPNRRTEHVLVVEDAEQVAAFVREVLEKDGHRVTLLPDGDQALAWLAAGNRPSALISDVVLVGARGTEVALAARSRAPHLPILLVTGYAPEELPPELDDALVLPKPFRAVDLRRWLSQLPDDRS